MTKKVNLKTNTLKAEESQAASSKKKKGKKKGFSGVFRSEKTRVILGLFMILLSFYLLLSFVSYLFNWKADDDLATSLRSIFSGESIARNHGGKLGHALAFLFIKKWFGIASLLVPLNLFVFGFLVGFNIKLVPTGRLFRISVLLILWLSTALAFIFRGDHLSILGGFFGKMSGQWLIHLLGNTGAGILLFFILIAFLITAYNLNLRKVAGIFRKKTEEPNMEPPVAEEGKGSNVLREEEHDHSRQSEDKVSKPVNDDVPDITGNEVDFGPVKSVPPQPAGGLELTIEKTSEKTDVPASDEMDEESDHYTIDTPYDPRLDLSDYRIPSIDLLQEYGDTSITVSKEELEENKNRIVETLNNYGIPIERIKATVGPTITLYEIVPAPGIRISKIKNLSDDIALSLSAIGIRIIAPLPGKGTIGIEVPNKNPETVSIKSILTSERFTNSKFELPIGLGKTISNDSYIADLTRMPHLLIAGATGQGKSVGLNAIITSLLYKKHPAELKFVMVDPKKVELTLFSKIERHFLAKLPDASDAIITDTKQVVRTLNSLNIEMEKRYTLLNQAEVRNIREYNKKFLGRQLNPENGHQFLPYIVVIIDEFADLIMMAGKEVELPLTRLAQLARAIGIHLVIATQRPSINIITGTIKANFPARMAFRVISSIDSRTILDSVGANQLIGRGDMLLSTGSDLLRLQCAFVDTPEVARITSFIGEQRGYLTAFDLPEFVGEDDESNKEFDPNDRDELFEEAARIIVQHQHGSTSLLQRKLKLGYNRAGRIIDQLEAAGIVGPFEGSKAREVRFRDELSLEQYLRENNL